MNSAKISAKAVFLPRHPMLAPAGPAATGQAGGESVPVRTRLFVGGFLAAGLALLSWANGLLVPHLNEFFFHRPAMDVRGWWLYVALRLPLVMALLFVVFGAAPASSGRVKPHAQTSRTFDPLLGLRAMACVLVLLGHYFLVVFPFPNGTHPVLLLALLRSNPWAGVWLFFTLSGFLMGKGFLSQRYSLDDSGVRSFLRNRLLRLLPIYYCDLLLVCVLRYPAILHPRNWWMLLSLCTFDYRGTFPISPNGALWSISTEMQFYFLVPLLVFGLLALHRRMGAFFVSLPVVVLLAGLLLRSLVLHRLSPARFYEFGYTPLLTNLDLFVTGLSLNLLPRLSLSSARTRVWLRYLLLGGGLSFVVIASLAAIHGLNRSLVEFWVSAPLPCGLFAAAFILIAEHAGKIPMDSNLRGRALWLVSWIGTLTYCLYVFHPDVLLANHESRSIVPALRTSLLLFPQIMAEVVVVAVLMYFLVEQPFDRIKHARGTALTDAP